MSNSSNDDGRAFEYAIIMGLQRAISQYRCANIIVDNAFHESENAWKRVSSVVQSNCELASESVFDVLINFEPKIVENDANVLTLQIQPDMAGKTGDVRDILIAKTNEKWEIGISAKYNNFAVKHSRISDNIDFGSIWYGVPCSTFYWNTARPIFYRLKQYKRQGKKWSEIVDKPTSIYRPLLEAFVNEIKYAYSNNNDIPKKIMEYLIGKYDFYKTIAIESEKSTFIQAYNFHKKLNKSAGLVKPLIKIPAQKLPSKLIDFQIIRDTTAEMYLNNGWTLSFRIHNADTYVAPTLKFDIRFIGLPQYIVTVHCGWRR